MSKAKAIKKRPIYVLDTNVLLYNPRAIYAFPDADVIIPDIVLGELDKVKTSRADRELRYRSRQISRILFEFTEHGKLTDGIPFGKNSIVRVISFNPAKGTPELFGNKNSDDKILAIAYQVNNESNGRPVTIVTNDLNMLLKAQTIGIKVEHPGEEFAYGGVKRTFYILKTKKKAAWSLVSIAAAIVALIFLPQITKYLGIQQTTNIPEGPPEIIQSLQDYQNQVKVLNAQKDTYEAMLKRNPKDLQALIGIGNIYFDLGRMSEDPKNHQKAIDYYKRALAIDPNNSSVRSDMGVEYFNLRMFDLAVKELEKVINKNPDFYQAYYNLGYVYYEGLGNPVKAKDYLTKSIEKAPKGSRFSYQSESLLRQIEGELKAHVKGR